MFMKNILNLPDTKRRFLANRYELLKEIVQRYLIRIPFQSVTSMGSIKVTAKGRPVPHTGDLISANIRGVGGLCSHNNYFLRLQLESIGYDVTTISGCFRRTGIPASHFINLVKIPGKIKNQDKQYFVDVGCGVPLHEPLCLAEFPFISRAGGLNFRYERVGENELGRVNENGDAILGERPSGFDSPQDYTINLTPTTLMAMQPAVKAAFHNPRSVFIHQGIYLFRYLSITEDDFECVCIRGTELVLITKETRKSQTFKDYYELRPSIDKYFPMLDPVEVDKAIVNYSTPSIHFQKQ